jgi:hypothetical protein
MGIKIYIIFSEKSLYILDNFSSSFSSSLNVVDAGRQAARACHISFGVSASFRGRHRQEVVSSSRRKAQSTGEINAILHTQIHARISSRHKVRIGVLIKFATE